MRRALYVFLVSTLGITCASAVSSSTRCSRCCAGRVPMPPDVVVLSSYCLSEGDAVSWDLRFSARCAELGTCCLGSVPHRRGKHQWSHDLIIGSPSGLGLALTCVCDRGLVLGCRAHPKLVRQRRGERLLPAHISLRAMTACLAHTWSGRDRLPPVTGPSSAPGNGGQHRVQSRVRHPGGMGYA